MDKYKRPPNDPLFQSRSWADWQVEMYEDLYVRRDEIKTQLAEGGVDHAKAVRVLNAIESMLGAGPTGGDPIIDKWERELAEGKTPNLDD